MSLPNTFIALYSPPTKGAKAVLKELPIPAVKNNEVLVKVAFATINPVDVATLVGQWDDQSVGAEMVGQEGSANDKTVGYEGSGIVVAVGENLEYPVKVGDRVHIKGPGTITQYFLATSDSVFPIQGDLSLEDASSHFTNPATVEHMLQTVQRGGHKAVIHTAGASAVGKMLIRVLKQHGIKSINIVRRDDYIDELKKDGADYVLNSTAADFDAKLKEIATKEEATVTFDAIGGDISGKVLSAQPPKSILYIYGDMSKAGGINFVSIGDLFSLKSITGFTIRDFFIEAYQKGELRKVFTNIHSQLQTVYKTQVQKTFKLKDFKEAIIFASENSSKGKVLFQPN